jgi:hypothetical protein
MKSKRNVWLAALLLIVFAITRWPGLMPPNFSAAYALVFCAGLFFRSPAGWWAPLVVLAITDLLLNIYYTTKGFPAFQLYQLVNYPIYAALIWFGRRFDPKRSIAALVGGSLLGAVMFYLLTNFAAWLFNPFGNPEYTKTLAGLLTALTKGTGSWPQTWEFFRNTLLSSGLFTALFAAAYKYSAHVESAEEKKAANAPASENGETESDPEEASSNA